ncbi:endonuclease/exonuclease/phosphatase family protein [Microbacterium nymphoidis]|uniref:endonuclease/exonuclease/phosphatase family protein n=1 Tax=Microbacterium nymphoidis TaxID=2898586 RepID=UPI001E4DF28E|nr:endonuclease/exonuclease/phosphatase family protein [Microbacterium nymphoidis]MCD2498189.1 endonuclease/exonuclease/phosphatase family protein [Microbacterium nymphoidis]
MSQPHPRPQPTGRAPIRAGLVAALMVLLLVVIAGVAVPGLAGTLSAVTLPWLWLPAALVVVGGFCWWRRRWIALIPAVVWTIATASSLTWFPVGAAEGDGVIVAASQNVEAGSGTAAQSAAALVDRSADVIALTELDAQSRDDAIEALAQSHPYRYVVGTVGLWSTSPIIDAEALDLGLGWHRALRAEIESPAGPISVYVVHAASFRPGAQGERDAMLSALGDLIAQDDHDRILALGDFNAAGADPVLASIRSRLTEPRQASFGFGFTWPANLPSTRIDHIFQRGFDAGGAETLRAGASDHLAILVGLRPRS